MLFRSMFDEVVRKPFSATELLEKIGELVGVEYVRHDDAPLLDGDGATPGVAASLVSEDLSVLPADWLREFSRALRRGRSAPLLDAIERIRPDHVDLARGLTELVRIHAYDRLMALTELTREGSSHGD